MDEAARRFVDELRATINDFLSYQHSAGSLDEASSKLRELRPLLAGPVAPRYYEADLEAVVDKPGGVGAVGLAASPFGGVNPVSPASTTAWHPDPVRPSATGTVVAGRTFEGPARSVHGGTVAGLFDHYLGNTQNAWILEHGEFMVAATVELTVRYHRPTPIDTELTFEAYYEDVDDRYAHGVAECRAGDVVTATAEGRFRKLDKARFFPSDGRGFGK